MQHLLRADTVGLTVRVAGTVHGTVDLVHAGKLNQHVRVTVGSVTHIVRRVDTLVPIEVLWRSGAMLAERLPEASDDPAAHAALHKAAHTVHLTGEPLGLLALVPAIDALNDPEYLRVHSGPVVWQVLDQAAHASIARLWRTADALLKQALMQGKRR
ncbi:hypothetical protein ACQPW3_13400 [Actinosynnema sp. CA-248983]